MAEDKRMETMLAQTSREETEEVLDFMNTLDPYEKREFIGIMRGAKMVKAFQTAKQEAPGQTAPGSETFPCPVPADAGAWRAGW